MTPQNSLRYLLQQIWLLPWPGRIVLPGFAVLALAYALYLPSFEGPDESEHTRHIEAWVTGATIEAPEPGQPPEWGYQINQPPLYYWLLANYAKIVRPEFYTKLTINPTQNPRFPFIRHNLPGDRFPWTGEHLGLRLLRLPSVLIGLLTALVMVKLGAILFPKDTWAQVLFLTLGLLSPNILQLFAIVNNEGLALPLSVGATALAVVITRRRTLSFPLFGLCGLVLALNLLAKLTALISVATVGSLLLIDMLAHRRWAYYLRGAPILGIPLVLTGGAWVVANYVQYEDPLRLKMMYLLAPDLFNDTPTSPIYLLYGMFRGFSKAFLADLAWQTYRFSGPGYLLFWPWLLSLVGWTAMLIKRRLSDRQFHTEHLLPLLVVIWCVIFELLAFRYAKPVQLRHLLSGWPIAMLSLVYLATAIHTSWRRWIVWSVLVALLSLNVWLLSNFRVFYQGDADPDFNRDYHTFIYSFCQNRERGYAYAKHGSHLSYDVEAAFSDADWLRVDQLIEDAPPQTMVSHRALYLYAISLSMSDRTADSLAVCKTLAPNYPEAQPLQVKLTLLKGDYATAEQLLQNYIPSSSGNVREQLKRLQAELQTTAETSFD